MHKFFNYDNLQCGKNTEKRADVITTPALNHISI